MKDVCILVPDQCVVQAVADPQYLFSAVNNFLVASGRPAAFNVLLAGATSSISLNGGLYTVHPNKLLDEVDSADLIIIPALFGDMKAALAANQALIPWIKAQFAKGAEVASLCVGAFLLADTGLLDGKKCSTHWGFQNEFRERFPNVDLQDGNIVTEEDGIYSSGGANSYWGLLLHLVEKYTDRELAVLASKYFAIDIDRSSQAAYALFKGQKKHSDIAVKRAQSYIEEHYKEKISVDELAAYVSLGRRSFERRFKDATNNTVLTYVHRIKMEAAKRQFENSKKTINEVMYDIGYSDSKSFRLMFKKITGLTPAAYRNKYNKQAMSEMRA